MNRIHGRTFSRPNNFMARDDPSTNTVVFEIIILKFVIIHELILARKGGDGVAEVFNCVEIL